MKQKEAGTSFNEAWLKLAMFMSASFLALSGGHKCQRSTDTVCLDHKGVLLDLVSV